MKVTTVLLKQVFLPENMSRTLAVTQVFSIKNFVVPINVLFAMWEVDLAFMIIFNRSRFI